MNVKARVFSKYKSKVYLSKTKVKNVVVDTSIDIEDSKAFGTYMVLKVKIEGFKYTADDLVFLDSILED